MRLALIAAVAVLLLVRMAHAEDMVALAGKNGLMCRDAKALADLTAPDGTSNLKDPNNRSDPHFAEFRDSCQALPSEPVHVVSKRHNTSIVTYDNQTWYVANIDFMALGSDCLKDGQHVTLTGHIQIATGQMPDEKTNYDYPRLTLDKPVCYLGMLSEKNGRYVSLPSTTLAGRRTLMGMRNRHVTVTGDIGSPDNGHQPPDSMMMFDPNVTPVP